MKPLSKLNIACGPNIFPFDGWINADKYDFASYFAFVANPQVPLSGMPDHQRKLANFLRSGADMRFMLHDMTKPFEEISDSSLEYIYCGQAIEHLNRRTQAPVFLADCLRMLQPGGVLRMATPDLAKILDAFRLGEMNRFDSDQPDFYKTAGRYEQLAYLLFGASGDNCTAERYEGHFFCYSPESIETLLLSCGFKEVAFTWCGSSAKRPDIAKEVRDEGYSHSLIVEAIR